MLGGVEVSNVAGGSRFPVILDEVGKEIARATLELADLTSSVADIRNQFGDLTFLRNVATKGKDSTANDVGLSPEGSERGVELARAYRGRYRRSNWSRSIRDWMRLTASR